MPFETISLPTKQTTGSRVGSIDASASGAPTSMPTGSYPARTCGQLLASGGGSRRGSQSASIASAAAGPKPVALRRLEPAHERVEARPAPPSGSRGAKVWMSTPGRAQERALAQVLERHRRPQALGRVPRADQHRPRRHQPLARVGREPLVVRLQRVLERRAVDLHGVGHVAEAAREDHRAHQEVVGEAGLDVGGRRDVAHRAHVRVEVAIQLLVGEAVEGPHLEALVVVVDVHRQQAADVGPVDGAAARRGAGAARRRPRAGRPPRSRPSRRTRAVPGAPPGRAGAPRGRAA